MVVSEPMKKTIDYQHKETSYLDDTIYEIKINFSENRAVNRFNKIRLYYKKRS